MYKSIESLCCAPGINIVLDVNYTSKINKLKECVVVQQKPSQHYKAIILRFKINFFN